MPECLSDLTMWMVFGRRRLSGGAKFCANRRGLGHIARRRAPEVFSRAGRFTDAFALLYPTAAFSVGQSRIQCIVLNIGLCAHFRGAVGQCRTAQEEIVQTLILTLHIIVCVLLVILILLQSGKEGMGVIFGGGNASVFGSSGAGSILAKLTALMAVIFVITSLSYTYVTSSRPSNDSTILNVKIEEPAAPVNPAVEPEQKSGQASPDGQPGDRA